MITYLLIVLAGVGLAYIILDLIIPNLDVFFDEDE